MPEFLRHWRLKAVGLSYWAAGKRGCCSVWYYSSPVMAIIVSRRRHRNRIRLDALHNRDWRSLNGRVSIDVRPSYRTVREGQPWRQSQQGETT